MKKVQVILNIFKPKHTLRTGPASFEVVDDDDDQEPEPSFCLDDQIELVDLAPQGRQNGVDDEDDDEDDDDDDIEEDSDQEPETEVESTAEDEELEYKVSDV